MPLPPLLHPTGEGWGEGETFNRRYGNGVRRGTMRKSLIRSGIWIVLGLGLLACSRFGGDTAEPSIPDGQCVVSGISTREDPNLGTQALGVLQARGVNVTAVVGANRG